MASEIEILGNEYMLLRKEEYADLVRDSDWLACLEAAGVDNWEGYDVAIRMLEGEDE